MVFTIQKIDNGLLVQKVELNDKNEVSEVTSMIYAEHLEDAWDKIGKKMLPSGLFFSQELQVFVEVHQTDNRETV